MAPTRALPALGPPGVVGGGMPRSSATSVTGETARMVMVAPEAADASARRDAVATAGSGTAASSAPSAVYSEASAGAAVALPTTCAAKKSASEVSAVLTAAAGLSKTSKALDWTLGDKPGDASTAASTGALGAALVTRAKTSVQTGATATAGSWRRRRSSPLPRHSQASQSAPEATTGPRGSATGALAPSPGAAASVAARNVREELTTGCTAAAAQAANLHSATARGSRSSERPPATASSSSPQIDAVNVK